MTSDSKEQKVWEKASRIRGENPDMVRRDSEGNKIRRDCYGKQSTYGWEIDHINPKAKGGSNNLGNLQPLHWEANREKADKSPKK